MIDCPAFLALVISLTEYGIVIAKFRMATIPTPAFKFEGFACRPIDQFRPFEYFHLCISCFHKHIISNDYLFFMYVQAMEHN